MAQAPRDDNRVTTLLGVSSVDGATPTTIYVNPSTHRILATLDVSDVGAITGLTDGEAVDVADKGFMTLGTDGSNYQVLSTDSTGKLNVLATISGDVGTVDQMDLTNANPLTVAIVDADGTQITSFGGIQYAEDAAHQNGDSGVMVLAIRDDDPPTATSGTVGDYEPLHTDAVGRLWTHPVPTEADLATANTSHVKKYYTSAGAVTDGIIWSPAAGKRWYITSIFIGVSAASTVTLEDDLVAGDSAIWKMELAANSGWSQSFPIPWFSGEDAADLIVTSSAGNIYCTVVGYEV